MESDNEEDDVLQKRMELLSHALREQAKKIAAKNGIRDEFHLSVSSTMSDDYSASIHAGTPPRILINASFAMACIGDSSPRKTEMRRLAFLLARMVELVPRFAKNLFVVPKDFYAALPFEGKRLVKTPKKLFVIDESKVAYTFSVTATQISTGDSITIDFTNPRDWDEYKRYAAMKLARLGADIQKELVEEEKVIEPVIETNPANISFGSAAVKSIDFSTVRIDYDKTIQE